MTDINTEKIIQWYLSSFFNGHKPENHAILQSKVEKLRGFLREIYVDSGLAKKLLDDYWKEN